ncbi:unnamed protein product [Orchesella dallaii]|uniref:Uncharacterized protein n=1 Tax=Orchesella dallaii TaxID=48710 RepID=A0ABP1S2D3_9HEXA
MNMNNMDSTFILPHDGAAGADLSTIFEGDDEEVSRNYTFDSNNPTASDRYSYSNSSSSAHDNLGSRSQSLMGTHYEAHNLRQIQSSSLANQAYPSNFNSLKADHEISNPVFRTVDQLESDRGCNLDQSVVRTCQASGSDGSVSINELYENAQAFNGDSCSEIDASSDEAFITQAKLHSEEDGSVDNVCNVASSVYSESFLGRTDIFRPMLSNEQRKMLGLGSIPVTPIVSSTPSSRASRSFTIEMNLPHISGSSSCGVNAGVGGGGDADQVKSSHTSNVDECELQMQNLRVSIAAASDTESMGPMMDGKTVSDSEQHQYQSRMQSNKKRVSFSDCEGELPRKDRSCQISRTLFGVSPASRYRYKLPRFSTDTGDCIRSHYFPSPLSTFKRKSLITSFKSKGAYKIGTAASTIKYSSVDEKGTDCDSNKSYPNETDNLDSVALSFSTEGTPIFQKNQELKGITSLSPDTLKSKKLETKMQSDMRGAVFDYESRWASEDVKFRRKVKSLELEYENKFLTIVQSHNTLQEKLYEKLMRKLQKIEKRVKKDALQGRLKEGNCFHISHDIGNILS